MYNNIINWRKTNIEEDSTANKPACSSVLEFVNDQLFCKNNLCPAQSAKKLEHFAKTLKIKGLGPATIARLGLEDYHDIYSLSQEEISFLLDSEKLGTKLHAEIEKSKGVDLITLPSFFDTADRHKCFK